MILFIEFPTAPWEQNYIKRDLSLACSLSIYSRYTANDNQFKRFEMIIALMVTAAATTTAAAVTVIVIAWKVKISMLFSCIAYYYFAASFVTVAAFDWLEKSDLSDICCRQMKTIHQNVNKHIDTLKKKLWIDTRSYADSTLVKNERANERTNERAHASTYTLQTTTTLSNAKRLNNNTALPPVTRCEPKMNFV